ncbi:MAG: phenylalanine--tRNA ligase subunit beta [Rhodospirillaceae bacterium]
MKFTLSWLKYHLMTEATLGEITDKLSMLGLEVEHVDDRAASLKPFKIARVISAVQHPNADRLRLCVVDTGDDQVQVVCGAPNARAGIKGVFAPSGSYIPGTDLTLKPSKIRGEESNGMLCSEREMGISEEHGGIIELPDSAPVGQNWAEWAGINDPIIDIALTPNRGDCASVRGVARDLAAAGLGHLRPLPRGDAPGCFVSPINWKRDFPEAAADACPMVVGRYFRNVKNIESPDFIQDRLRAIGLKPISALVDITNWLTYDLGRPLHVFDADKVHGDLVMRFGRTGETIDALDDRTYELDETMIVIADDTGPQGIGGIMGGIEASCTENTKNVFLEVALFDPIRIAKAGRQLGIGSDARYRFERGIDPESVQWGCEIATRMILKFCGGEASEIVSSGVMPPKNAPKFLRADRIKTLTGVDISISQSSVILKNLGFIVEEKSDGIEVTAPSWRPDIDGEADLVEEVIRIYGFDKIPETTFPGTLSGLRAPRNGFQLRAERTRRALAGRGLIEAVTYSFTDADQAALFGDAVPGLVLTNPISRDLSVMRPSILPTLCSAIARNQARGVPNPLLFELGPQYEDDSPGGQRLVAAGVRVQNAVSRHWSESPREVDVIDAKGDAFAALDAAGAPVDNLRLSRDAPRWYHPGRSGSLRLGKSLLGYFGELHPLVIDKMDVIGPVAAFEIFLDALPLSRNKGHARKLLDVSPFQPVYRDFAFIVDQGVESQKILNTVRNADRTLIADVTLFDVYQGKGLDIGKKSLGVEVTLQPKSATLTDDEINSVSEKIISEVKEKNGGDLR